MDVTPEPANSMLLSDSSLVLRSLLGGVGVKCGAVENVFILAAEWAQS